MRVLLVNTLFPPFTVGGAEESVAELAVQLGESGHQVTIACLGPASRRLQEVTLPDVSVARLATRISDAFESGARRSASARALWHLREGWRPRVAAFLRSVMEDVRPDLVHTHSIAGFGTAAWARPGALPLVHTLRDYYLVCGNTRTYRDDDGNCVSACGQCTVLRAPQRLLPSRPDLFVGISQAVLDRHRHFGYLRDSDRTAVVPNQPHVGPLPARRRRGLDRAVFGFIGRLDDYKGLWKVLDAFAELPADCRFVVAGDGDEAARSALAARMAADDRIAYLGRVDKTSFYAQVDVVLVPSQWHEPFGRVAGEGVQAGRLVLVSGIGGLPEAVGGSPLGRVVADYGNVAAWAAAMAAARADVAAGELHTGTSPVVRSVADQYVELYRSVLAGRNEHRGGGW